MKMKQAPTYVDPLGPLTHVKMSLLEVRDDLRRHLAVPVPFRPLWQNLEHLPPAAARAELEQLLVALEDLVRGVAPRQLRAAAGGSRRETCTTTPCARLVARVPYDKDTQQA